MYDQHVCGGSILRISDDKDESDLILTAAHCVVDASTGTLSSFQQKTVVAGSHSKRVFAKGEQKRKVVEVKFHESYSSKTVMNDIAIIRLDKSIKFSETIRPICIPRSDDDLPTKRICIVTGWGRNESQNAQIGKHQNELKQAQLELHPSATCRKLWYGSADWENAHICGGPLSGKESTCMGDSGGPYVCQNDDKSWSQQGIVSFGASARCSTPNRPPVFTRVAKYQNWIEDKIKDMSALLKTT